MYLFSWPIKEDPGIQKVQTHWNELLDQKSKIALTGESLTFSVLQYVTLIAYRAGRPAPWSSDD